MFSRWFQKPKTSLKLICLIGESGSGKTTLADRLKKHGYTSIPSYTTRSQRGHSDQSHVFVTADEFQVLEPELIAHQTFDGFSYGVTREQVKAHHIFVVDPRGLEQVRRALPHGSVIAIYVEASPAERLRRMAATRGSNDALRRIDHDTNYFSRFRGYDVLLKNETEDDLNNNERIVSALMKGFF